VERVDAEAVYYAGREAVVEVALVMDRRIQQLEARVQMLERELAKSSRNSSLPHPPSKRFGALLASAARYGGFHQLPRAEAAGAGDLS
jgi:hypothetical protein